MNASERLYRRLRENRLIALVAPETPAQALAVFEALDPLGITVEIAFRSEAASAGIRTILKSHPDALVLAGTILTAAQAEEALAAGAAGIVSADYIPEVVEACVRADTMVIPGGLSDAGKQLAQKAAGYGLTLDGLRERRPWQWIYKLFPAVAGKADHSGLASAWRGPYKDLAVVYTGGVTLDNLADLALRDPAGIFCGSALARNTGDPEAMKREALRWIEAVRLTRPVDSPKRPDGPLPAPVLPPKVVTFGEIMLRLSPPGFRRFAQARSFEAGYGGAEANVAVALARFGLRASFASALPSHELGQAAVDELRSQGVETSAILRRDGRMGIYFLEPGASQRPSKVLYDREGSSLSRIGPGVFDWKEIFAGGSWFHWSGITPALSEGAAAVTAEAVREARRAGLTVSADLNYRKKLWSRDKARAVLTPLMEFTDVVFANEEDATDVFGIAASGADAGSGRVEAESYRFAAEELVRRFGLRKALITLRKSLSASVNEWSGCLSDGTAFLHSRTYTIQLVDRIGAGDAFAAGFICAALSGQDDRSALEFAAAASCLKQTVPGDFALATREEIEALAAGSVAGRVQR